MHAGATPRCSRDVGASRGRGRPPVAGQQDGQGVLIGHLRQAGQVYKAELTSSAICLRPCRNVPLAIWMPPLVRLPAFQIEMVSAEAVVPHFHRNLRPVVS